MADSPYRRPGPFRVVGSSDQTAQRLLGPASRLVRYLRFRQFGPARTANFWMVRPGARKGDDDLGPVPDRTGQVEGRAVTASSRCVRDATVLQTYRPLLHLLDQPPHTSYVRYAHAPYLPIRMPGQDRTQYFSKTQIPLNEVSGLGLQLGAQFFELLVASVLVDSFYSGADYGVTDCGIPSSDVGMGRDSGTSRDGDRTRSEEPVMVCSLHIHGGEDDEDEPEDDGGDDDDDDSDGHGDNDEPIPVAHASSSGCTPAPGRGKGLTDSFMSVMSKIARSRQKRPEKSHPPTNSMQKKKAKNAGWEQTGPTDGGPQDPILIPSYSGHIAGSIWCG
ncbi:hypothetical protein M9H77_22520 [Catharanthus roseus]|uniref:Uncharacterized protein n=1 Tax=Catharanthus roseus TaxID=4058 RepID=A0ACC0AT87_CATRO|nr:hypothetical protein M9H77_22520 [Catharanthus roseus]